MLKVCLNGDRSRLNHPHVPLTPDECAAAAAACIAVGAEVVHVHPRGEDLRESLRGTHIAQCVRAIRAEVTVPVSVSTRDGIAASTGEKLALVRQWPSLDEGGPDCASVNWHEPGADQLADLLREKGIGVEAGIWSPRAAIAFVASDWTRRVDRVLVEAIPGASPGGTGVLAAERILSALGRQPRPVVVHGEGPWAWEVLRWAQREGYGTRVGLEDVLELEDGRSPRDNAELVRVAQETPGLGRGWWPAPDPSPLPLA